MASKEKVDIRRSDQFQEVDEELARAMADLDSTIERVNAILHPESEEAERLLVAEQPPTEPQNEKSGHDATAQDDGPGSVPAPAADAKETNQP